MVEQIPQLNSVFSALADPTRRSMLDTLLGGECSVKKLAEPFNMSLAGAAKHVQVLEKSGLIVRRKEGRTWYCAINKSAFDAAQQWFDKYSDFWNANLDTLTDLLAEEQNSENQDE